MTFHGMTEGERAPYENPPCPTCGGVGWHVVNQTWDWPYGEQKQCPDCWDEDHRELRDNGFVWPDLPAGEDSSWAIDLGSNELEHVFDHLEAL